MSRNSPSARVTGADYDAIEEAVMETARGRWFLSEYARRNRAADTASVLEALGRLEEITSPLERPPEESELVDTILTIIDDARAAPWQGISDQDNRAPQLRPTQASKGATAAIRSTAEKIREVGFELRETAKLEIYANALDLYCADLANAALLQESATSRLAELSGLVMAIENQLSGHSNTAIPASQPEDQARRDSGSSSSENTPIALTELPQPSHEQTVVTGEERETLLSGTEQTSSAAKEQASALLFVNPN
ncbi:MAG: hypothetical protein ACTSWI_07080 [Alphaproteobacteria bacterium]